VLGLLLLTPGRILPPHLFSSVRPRLLGTSDKSSIQVKPGEVRVVPGYTAPDGDNTRGQYFKWFQDAQRDGDDSGDSGGAGLKEAAAQFENSWYIASSLAMTVGFAFLMMNPEPPASGNSTTASADIAVARYTFLSLSLLGTINSVLGVWWAGHSVPQVYWHPARDFSKFWFASLNTSMGNSQQYAKVGMEQLVFALLPLCYIHYGAPGLQLCAASIAYLFFSLKTRGHLMQRMRSAYQEGVDRGTPVMDNTDSLPCPCCKYPYLEGLPGWLTCHILGPACFAFRWCYSPSGDWIGAAAAAVDSKDMDV
jgi:hypothetical protein